jgi:hypothetical protein
MVMLVTVVVVLVVVVIVVVAAAAVVIAAAVIKVITKCLPHFVSEVLQFHIASGTEVTASYVHMPHFSVQLLRWYKFLMQPSYNTSREANYMAKKGFEGQRNQKPVWTETVNSEIQCFYGGGKMENTVIF